ncbi:MAG: T9SS type A sorting domain-containing protein [Saprospiraceae bacterium]
MFAGATLARNAENLDSPPDTIFIDIACIGDRELYNRFGGQSDPQAETRAINYMDTIMRRVANRFAPIFNTYDPSSHFYQFRIVTIDVVKDNFPLYGSFNIVEWSRHTDFWKNAYPCADDLPDIIHVFSGYRAGHLTSPSGKSFYGWSDGEIFYDNTCYTGRSITMHDSANGGFQDSLYNLALVAHEMGHNFDLDHLESTNCKELCATEAYLMCESNNNSTLLSSCDYTNLQNLMTIPKLINCLKPAIRATVDSNCTHCQITLMPMTSPEVVARGCDGHEEFDYEVEVWNNCDSADRIVRIDFGKKFFDVVDPGIFTAVENQSLLELKLLGTSGQEIPVTFDSEEKKKFTVRLKVKDHFTNALLSIWVRVLSTNGSPIRSYEHKLPNAVNVSTTPGVPVNNLPTASYPALILNTNLILTSNNYTNDSIRYIFCKPGVYMLIQSPKATFTNVQIVGCTDMWKGIDVAGQSNFTVESSQIMDAQYALNVQLGARLTVTNTRFENNNIGIRYRDISSAGNPDSTSVLIAGNSFLSKEGLMKPAYSGQSPLPSSKGYAGIYLLNAPAVTMQKSSAGNPNTFDGLLNGVVGINSAVMVKDAIFRNMSAVTQPLTGYPTVWTGVGVFASNSFVSVEGMGASPGAPPSFENCPVGIETAFSSLTVKNNRMADMGEGIRFLLGTNNLLDINNNRIEASVRGISTFQPGVFSHATSIANNFITMDDDEVGIGIQLGIADGPKLPVQKASVKNNTITMNDGLTGVRISTARGVDLYGNVVEVENATTRNGIHNLGSHNLLVHCNYVYGDDVSVNLRSDGTWQSTWACNGSDGGAVGLNFSGECSGSTVRGNRLIGINEGMYYGMPGTTIGTVLVGTQEHRGNIFDNSGAVYAGILASVSQNRYIVDPNQNSQFFPTSISGASNWFVPETNTSTAFACTFIDCPPQSLPIPHEDDDTLIVGSLIFAEHFAETLLGQAKKHLFTRLSEDGLPGGSTQALQDFMSPGSATAYQQFGDVDLAFRDAFSVSGATDTLLHTYELALASGLTTLRGLDSLLLSRGLSAQDSSAVNGQRDTLLIGIADTFDLWTTLRANLTDTRRSLLDSVAVQNSSLSPSLLWESSEKSVRSIYLATIGTDTMLTLNGTQTTQLEAIAMQCPLEGGTAVYWARMLLEMLAGTRAIYYDADSCEAASERYREMERLVKPSSVRVYPNPTSGVFRVEYDLGDMPGAVFMLYNSLGQQVLQQRLPDAYGTVLLNMVHLPPGTYYYMVSGLSGRGSAGKILISKH